MPKTRKKRKTRAADLALQLSSPKRDLFSQLPLEMLAEILRFTSTKDILAVARTSSHFCNTLVSIQSNRIWSLARTRFNPPLPDPTPNFTEASFAAYIFDGGPCEQCEKYIDEFYISFSLRVRLCSSGRYTSCINDWVGSHDISRATSDCPWKVYLEVGAKEVIGNKTLDTFWYLDYLEPVAKDPHYRSEKKRMLVYKQILTKNEEQKKKIMDLSEQLVKWSGKFVNRRNEVKEANQNRARLFANNEGWDFIRLKNSPTFKTLIDQKNIMIEKITDHDLDVVRDNVRDEIQKMVAKKERAMREENYRRKRKAFELEYRKRWKLRHEGKDVVLPTLSVFLTLPHIDQWKKETGITGNDMDYKLKQQLTRKEIDDDLSKWEEKMRAEFAEILGTQGHVPTDVNEIHQVDKCTALFLCSKCAHIPAEQSTNFEMITSENENLDAHATSLTFKDACSHTCHSKYPNKKEDWCSKNFVPDNKAISIARRCLALLDIEEDASDSVSKINSILNTETPRILCKSCDGEIVLSFGAMHTHSHRHEDMTFEILEANEAQKMPLVVWGLCNKLKLRGRMYDQWKNKKKFNCRHCLKSPYINSQSDMDATTINHAPEVLPNKQGGKEHLKLKLMTFDGITCHLKEKHGILKLGDEDIIVVRAQGEKGI